MKKIIIFAYFCISIFIQPIYINISIMKKNILVIYCIYFFSTILNAQTDEQYIEMMESMAKYKKSIQNIGNIGFKNIDNKNSSIKSFKNKVIQLHLYKSLNDSILSIFKKNESFNKSLQDSLSTVSIAISLDNDEKIWKDKIKKNNFLRNYQHIISNNQQNKTLKKEIEILLNNQNYQSFYIKIDKNNQCNYLDFLDDALFFEKESRLEAKINNTPNHILQGKIGYLKNTKKMLSFVNNIGNIPFIDKNNQQKSFKQFSGKYVRLHFWGTWCRNCNEKFQKESQYEFETADSLNMVNIAISFHDEYDDWQKFIKEKIYVQNYYHIFTSDTLNNTLKNNLKDWADLAFPMTMYIKIEKDGKGREIDFLKDEGFLRKKLRLAKK
ncbi:MAG: hypothetical protein EAZ06_06310 [Cytophagales bacterium]|nr:MAG: hypothetical protein EAZ06_06310 [Cytophagales bacterium]